MARLEVEWRRNIDLIRWCYKYIKELVTTRRLPDWQLIRCDRSYIQKRLYLALKKEGYKVKAEYETCGYQVDLVIKKYRIAIETDGAAYHSSDYQKKLDRKKTAVLRKHGWTVIRFTGKQVNSNVHACVEQINQKSGIHLKWWQRI
ncbi:Very-short-patch-repair endonuclease [Thermoactinomyces sp. DSM 45891]|uniref:endonuclease domain-containing protein n=1 Tax=Thermoactinomyces sp. DSM 45891 TaxID=1761907 RepID=UPI0009195B36|nr:DUF559 domain-containing protein [Thermoactinomyces sp. DSM 45891]SFX75130.1 Very-short-patch-repair endonuclease [Thermoactinomyces sp. DSM 45891]